MLVINGPFDTSLRVISSLEAAGDRGLTLELLRVLDVFVLYPGDLGGPGHLHVPVGGRLCPYTFRDEHVRQALDLLLRHGIVQPVEGRYRISKSTEALEERAYLRGLRGNAAWLAGEIVDDGEEAFLVGAVSRIEADIEAGLSGPDYDMGVLAENYRTDVIRLEAIAGIARWIARGASAVDARDIDLLVSEAEGQRRATEQQLRDLVSFRKEKEARGPTFVDFLKDALAPDEDTPWIVVDGLYSAYGGRPYHNVAHVMTMARELTSLSLPGGFPKEDVLLAILWHDVVYDPRAKDNEARSAEMFLADVPNLDEERRQRVASMIRATDHRRMPDDDATRLLVDLDLSILSSEPDVYDGYVAAIRKEYDFVTDDEWRIGRQAVLQAFLDRPVIYLTDHFVERDEQARSNIEREFAGLAD